MKKFLSPKTQTGCHTGPPQWRPTFAETPRKTGDFAENKPGHFATVTHHAALTEARAIQAIRYGGRRFHLRRNALPLDPPAVIASARNLAKADSESPFRQAPLPGR